MDYQTYRPMTIPSKTRKSFTKNTFAEHNYNYAHQTKKSTSPKKYTTFKSRMFPLLEFPKNIGRFTHKTQQIYKILQQMHILNPFNRQSFQPIQPQNPMLMHSYQGTGMQKEIPLPYYLQQHEITKNLLPNFSQMPNAAESLQMTMNPYLMGGSSITSNKPLIVFTGTDPEYSVEDYLNAVTVNLILNIGPEPINTPLHQNWIHRRTALIQTTLDGAAQK